MTKGKRHTEAPRTDRTLSLSKCADGKPRSEMLQPRYDQQLRNPRKASRNQQSVPTNVTNLEKKAIEEAKRGTN
jgi:hypothetical protein